MNIRHFLLPLSALVATSIHSLAAEAAVKPPLTPADNLVADGIPPIPADVVEQVGRYTEARAAAFLDWHPERSEMLIATRFGDTNRCTS